MDIISSIKERRSIRCFKSVPIPKEEVLEILEAGRYSPSGCNMQPWYFTVVTNKELLEEINIKTKAIMVEQSRTEYLRGKGLNPNYHVFFNAPCVIFVSYNNDSVTPIEDISVATQNILLQAYSMGIGSCWIGNVKPLLQKDSDVVAKLGIPQNHTPFHAISLGHTDFYPKTGPIKKEDYVNFID